MFYIQSFLPVCSAIAIPTQKYFLRVQTEPKLHLQCPNCNSTRQYSQSKCLLSRKNHKKIEQFPASNKNSSKNHISRMSKRENGEKPPPVKNLSRNLRAMKFMRKGENQLDLEAEAVDIKTKPEQWFRDVPEIPVKIINNEVSLTECLDLR